MEAPVNPENPSNEYFLSRLEPVVAEGKQTAALVRYARKDMGLFDKLRQTKKPGNPDLIQVFDKSGNPLYLTKESWRTNVLPGMLRSSWDNPNELYTVIAGTLRDGLPADVAEAAEHLYRIDANRSRAASAWASVLLGLKRVDEAEQILRSHIEQYGEEGYVVTNLAKAYAARNENVRAEATLWRALELDPNQEMAVGWFAALADDRNGKVAMVEAWERIAALPGSWRAQLWLARTALESRNIPRALALYREILTQVGDAVPVNLLKQMSGDLGMHGLLPELLELTEPCFLPEVHGLEVGNNLIKANIELGHLARARQIINQLRMLPRPDWKLCLSDWQAEIDPKGG